MKIVDLLWAVETETYLKAVVGEETGKYIAHEGCVGLDAVFKNESGIAVFETDNIAEKVNTGQQRLPAVPVDLYDPGIGIDSQVMVDDVTQDGMYQ
jgi:hypothetical protein